MAEWIAEWSGDYPNLCRGEWTLTRDGEDFSDYIPFRENACASTFGTYEEWSFDDNWSEQWTDYEAGLELDEWCEQNADWLSQIADESEWEDIFLAFQEKGWRSGSCGGCI